MNSYLRPLRGPELGQIGGIKGIGNRSENMENHLPLLIRRENGCLKVAGYLPITCEWKVVLPGRHWSSGYKAINGDALDAPIRPPICRDPKAPKVTDKGRIWGNNWGASRCLLARLRKLW